MTLSYKKVGGLRFVRVGRLGFSFFVSRRLPTFEDQIAAIAAKRVALTRKREANLARLEGTFVREASESYSGGNW